MVRAVSSWSARRRKRVVAGWLLFVVACVAAGSLTGTRELTDAGVGESGRAQKVADAAGLTPRPSETVMLRAADPQRAVRLGRTLARRLDAVAVVGAVDGPQLIDGPQGKVVLVRAELRGDPDTVGDRVAPVVRAVDGVRALDRGVRVDQAGDGSVNAQMETVMTEDLKRAETWSLPLTLLVLLLAFGALVAASLPLLIGITSAAAALGLLGPISQLVPATDAAPTLIVLIGLAVGVDYSLFAIRREREERARGLEHDAALAATMATVGRAIVVAGVTVMISLAGLLVSGLSVFASMAVGTIAVVAVAVLGSLTVLPAALSLLGDRLDRGRLPLIGRRRGAATVAARAGGGAVGAFWGRLAARATRRPATALAAGIVLLLALAVPALSMRTADLQIGALPHNLKVIQSYLAIERAAPGGPSSAELVVRGTQLDRASLQDLGITARGVTGGRGAIATKRSEDGRTAVVSVPMPDRGAAHTELVITRLRTMLEDHPDQVLVGGWQASSADFARQMRRATPIVIAFVLSLAFLVLFRAFGSAALAGAVIALNLLSVGAAYGLLTLVFQHDAAEGLLGFINTGTIASWVPLFAFVILFGLSMDYTILVLERMREARLAGRSPREAAAEGVAATAGTVTSAAIVMVAVFSLFAMMRSPDMKQFGFGLAAAIVLDATVVRALLLPAAVTLLGRRWQPEGRSVRGAAVASAGGVA